MAPLPNLRNAAVAMALAVAAAGCSSSPQPEPVALGAVTDVLAGEGNAAELAGGLPTRFLTGTSEQVDALLARREALAGGEPFSTLVDCGGMPALDSTALADRLLEPALEPGGPILLDLDGATARGLRGPDATGLRLVTVDERSRVTSRTDL